MESRLGNTLTFVEEVLVKLVILSSFIMMVLVTANAMGRYLFASSIPGSNRVVTLYLMPALVFLALSRVQHNDGNIRIDVVSRKLTDLSNATIRIISRSLILVVFLLITMHSGQLFMESLLALSTAIGIVPFPLYVSRLLVPLGFGLVCLRLLQQIVLDIKRLVASERGDSS